MKDVRVPNPFFKRVFVLVVTGVFVSSFPARAYSVLTHEAVIDAVWEEGIQPLLLQRFPNATLDDRRNARAHAYGGCIIQDLGYYPFSSILFTDLTHYVRTADFIISLIKNSRTIEEYAFALGALSHYFGDGFGHSLGVNPSVPLIYPKLAIYGSSVTYGESRSGVNKTEFGFDVLQVAHGNYVSQNYHDFIGFKVSKKLLERAFEDTYSISLKDLFPSLDLALGTYRNFISALVPEVTRAAWQTKKSEILKRRPEITEEKFVYKLTRSDYEKEWGAEFEKAGVGTKALAILAHILPRFGYLRELSYKPPPAEAEKLFSKSFEITVESYLCQLRQLRTGKLALENWNLDTGKPIKAGEYPLCDQTYAKLLGKLNRHYFKNVSAALSADILEFYNYPEVPLATQRHPKEWEKTIQRLNELKHISANWQTQRSHSPLRVGERGAEESEHQKGLEPHRSRM